MSQDDAAKSSPVSSNNFSASFEDALSTLKRTTGLAVRTGAMATMLAAGPVAGAAGCLDEGQPEDLGPVFTGADRADGWLDYEGQRNTDMVSFLGETWHEYYDCNTRGGCMGVAMFIKVRVQPVVGSDLDYKRVGVVFRSPGGEPVTAMGSYFTTYSDGGEEWHVRVDRRSWESGVFRFDAWYQDGLGNTFIDDNAGEGHVATHHGNYSVIRHYWDPAEGLTVDGDGVQGRLSFHVADLDYDKDIRMIWSTDGWATANEFGLGDGFTPNNVMHWTEDLWNGYERWAINVDLPGDFERFEYAVVYRHGVVNDADVYEFWDNNGGYNYVINRAE